MAEGQRRLAAIVAADVAGYSRLMGADEEGTIATLRGHRADVFDPKIAQYHGRIANTAGDSLLIEFPSAVDALRCAIEVQAEIAARNQEIPQDRRLEFRIGINVGDVVAEGDDLLGDGVNVAARLEGLAEAGGICLSRTARDQVRDRMEIALEDMGEVEVKNIARPVRAFRVLGEGEAVATAVPAGGKAPWLKYAAVIVAIFAVIAGGGLWWGQQQSDFSPADRSKMALALPNKPSIAVLPFDNLSGDKSQDYLGDGMTDHIISAISKIPEMFVVARNSTFTYKGKPVKVQQVAEELGVRYVLEGSVQRSGEKIRVIAQLVDALNGQHLWSEHYDRNFEALFEIQDNIALNLAVAMQVQLSEGDQARVRHRTTRNLKAWAYAVRGYTFFQRFNPKDNAQARRLFEQALELDPDYVFALTQLGWTYFLPGQWGWVKDPAASLQQSMAIAQKSLAVDDTFPWTYSLLAGNLWRQGKHDQAIAAGQRAIELNPNGADPHTFLSLIQHSRGHWDEVIELSKNAMRLHPRHPSWYLIFPVRAHVFKGEFEQAIKLAELGVKKAEHSSLRTLFYYLLAFAHMEAGDETKAKANMKEGLRSATAAIGKNLENYGRGWYFEDPKILERNLTALRKAGMPEHPPATKPKKPTIAVLPFNNFSDDKAQEYFADGMTEDLITDLSKISGLSVISRTSTSGYKGRKFDVREVGKALGVAYVIEGSVRKAGGRVRINAQLIDAVTGTHLWAERYDGALDDIFALQDRVLEKIVASLALQLSGKERRRIAFRGTASVAAHDLYLRGLFQESTFSREGNRAAMELYQRALKIDPDYALPYTRMANILELGARNGWSDDIQRDLNKAVSLAEKALSLDPEDPRIHWSLGRAAARLKTPEGLRRGIAALKQAIELDPDFADAYAFLGVLHIAEGRADKGLKSVETAMAMNPRHPFWYIFMRGMTKFALADYEAALTDFEAAAERSPTALFVRFWLAASYAQLDRIDDAEWQLEELRAMGFKGTIATITETQPIQHEPYMAIYRRALRKAGIPEG